jgi:large subunit ribosomal protein L9
MTKIILNQNVEKLGVAGDIVDVKPGYARNFLLPKAIAVVWTEKAAVQSELRKAAALRKAISTRETAEEVKTKLEEGVLVIPLKASPSGRLFGGVTGAIVADAAKASLHVTIDKRKVSFEEAIKHVGPATVKVQLLDDIVADVRINVVAASKKA